MANPLPPDVQQIRSRYVREQTAHIRDFERVQGEYVRLGRESGEFVRQTLVRWCNHLHQVLRNRDPEYWRQRRHSPANSTDWDNPYCPECEDFYLGDGCRRCADRVNSWGVAPGGEAEFFAGVPVYETPIELGARCSTPDCPGVASETSKLLQRSLIDRKVLDRIRCDACYCRDFPNPELVEARDAA